MIDDEITHEGLDEDLKPADSDNGSDDGKRGDQSDDANGQRQSQSASEKLPENEDDWAAGLVKSMNLTGDESEEEVDPSEDDDNEGADFDDHQDVNSDNEDGGEDDGQNVDEDLDSDEDEGNDLTDNDTSLSDKEWKHINAKTRSQIKGLRKRAKQAEAALAQSKSDADFGNNINTMVSEVGASDAIFDSYMGAFENLYTNPQLGIQQLENIADEARKLSGLPSRSANGNDGDSVDPLLQELADEYMLELDDPKVKKLAARLSQVGNDANQRNIPPMRKERDDENSNSRNLRNGQNGEQPTPQGLVDFKNNLVKKYPNEWKTLEPEVATEMMVQAKKLKRLGATVSRDKLGELANDALQSVLKRKKRSNKPTAKSQKPLRSNQARSNRRPRGDKQYADLGNLVEDITSGRIR